MSRKTRSLIDTLRLVHVIVWRKIQGTFSLSGWDTTHNIAAHRCAFWSVRLLPPANKVWGKVMFLQLFVSPHGGGEMCLWVRGVCTHPLDTHPLWIQTPDTPLVRSRANWFLNRYMHQTSCRMSRRQDLTGPASRLQCMKSRLIRIQWCLCV